MKKINLKFLVLIFLMLVFAGCDDRHGGDLERTGPNKNPFPSTYQVKQHEPFLIKNANVLDGLGSKLENTDILIENGKIKDIGISLEHNNNYIEINASNFWITPGLIDVHSHMGVYAAPGTSNHSDGNEMTSPVTAEVWAEHSVWPGDPQFEKALAGGVTTLLILPGSGNLIGGRGVTLKNIPSITVQGMKFPGAPYSLKMACG